MSTGDPAIQLEDLEVVYRVRGVDRPVLRGLSITIEQGESYGLVGESGCGKTTAAFTIMRYLPRNGRVVSGSIRADGKDLLAMGESEVRRLRASTVSMVYQNPGAALNPAIRVGDQIAEVFRLRGHDKGESLDRAQEMLRKVQISDPAGGMRRYPHQLSGGTQQRVVIAMALASDPTLLILDEPTTGLDATVEAEVLDLVAALRKEFGTSVLFISHNLAVIREDVRAGRRPLRRPARRGGRGRDGLHRAAPSVHGRAPTLHPARRAPQGPRPPGHDPRLPAAARAPTCRAACSPTAAASCRRSAGPDEPPLHPLGNGHSSRCHFHDKAADLPKTVSSPSPSRLPRR